MKQHQQQRLVCGSCCCSDLVCAAAFCSKEAHWSKPLRLAHSFYVLCQTNVLMLKGCCWNTLNMNEASLCEQDNDCPHSDSERMHSCICNGSRSVLLSCDKQNVLHKIKDNFVIKPCGYYIGKCVSYHSPHDLAEAHKKEEKKNAYLYDSSRWLRPITINSFFNL